MTDDREKKLPMWAQDMLLVLRLENREKDRQLAIARKKPPVGATGRITVDCLMDDGFWIGDRSLVRFKVPGGKIDVMLRENGTLLDLNSDGAMVVLPRASNSIHVKVDNPYEAKK